MIENRNSQSSTAAGIRRIEVAGLFGQRDYKLEAPSDADPDLSRVMILYGGNGSGKTTILQGVYDLLSGHPAKGHRSRLGNLPFRQFVVTFRDGRVVGAERRSDACLGPYRFFVSDPSGVAREAMWRPELRKRDVRRRRLPDGRVVVDDHERYSDTTGGEDQAFDEVIAYLSVVVSEVVYYMRDDRRLESDRLPDDEDEAELRRRVLERELQSWAESAPDPRTLALTKSLERTHRWISSSVLGASAAGGESTNAVYVGVAQRLAASSIAATTSSLVGTGPEIKERLLALGRRNEGFARLGLLPSAPAAELVSALESTSPEHEQAMISVLEPFADALSARLDALEGIRLAITTLLEQAGYFLTGKHVEFSLKTGLQIVSDSGEPLDPGVLSSGEKHLLLLLTSTVYTRDEPALYIIDEPELSLNMKWQRRLVDALTTCTRNTSTSFLMASHSFELMAAARERVVALTD